MDYLEQPHVRVLGETPAGDDVWDELLDAIRRWMLLYGAPERSVIQMVEDDYQVLLTPQTVRWLLNGTSDSPVPRH